MSRQTVQSSLEQQGRCEKPSRAEVEEVSRAWVESGPGAAQWELVSAEQRDRIRERMLGALMAGRRVRR